MVELAVHQKPLHQVDVFLAGGAGAAESAPLDCRNRVGACLHGLDRQVHATGDVVRRKGDREETSGEGGRWRVMGEGGDHIRSQDLRMWIVHSV